MKVVLVLAAAFLAVLSACGGDHSSLHGNPVGVYELDKAAFRAVILAAMPEEKRSRAEEIATVDKTVEAMSMGIELRADGTAAFRMTAPRGDGPKEQTATGTWSAEGDRLTITAVQNGTSDVRKAVFDGTSFTVQQATPTGPIAMTFRRR